MVNNIVSVYSSYAIIPFVLLLLVEVVRRRRTRPTYPPGPKGLPLIGSVFDVPKDTSPWFVYSKWARQYQSDIIHFTILGSHLFVLNSTEVASDLLDKRSTVYSDRPRLPMLVELMGWDLMSLYHYNDKWRASRRLFSQFFNVNAVTEFHPQIIKATHELVYRLVQKPEDFMDLIQLYTGSLILNVTYGIDVQSSSNPFLVTIETAMAALKLAGNPGAFLVDTMPLLKYVPEWVPGAGFKRKARVWRKDVEATVHEPFNYVKREMEAGSHAPSMTSIALERLGLDNDAQALIRGTTATSFAGASDTTVSAISTLFLAMVLYPEVLKKAQAELDRVVGRDRLPEFSDLPSLPYVGAIINEIHRYNPATPLGLAHRATEDGVYKGYFIPEGSIVVANIWSMLHDENTYKDPEKFDPERFLKDGKLNGAADAAFGFGRRICPGRHFAHFSVFLTVSHILSTFDITNAVDENGKIIIPTGECTSGSISRPLPFKCSIKPRSKAAVELVNEAYYTHHSN